MQIAKNVFERIQKSNPKLKMSINDGLPNVELEMLISKQPGLDFDVCLNLKNENELQLNVGFFHGQWFPCTEATKAKEFESAVNGLLRGAYRVEIIYRGGKPVKACLQKPTGSLWSTIYTHHQLHLPFGKKTTSHVQNQSNT